MGSPWTLVGNVVELDDENNTVRIGPQLMGTLATPKLQVTGTLVTTEVATIPLQDKGGNVFDVRAYGAAGDGMTDDRAPIQAAVDAMPANGGTLYFPPGNYVVGKDPLPANNWAINIEDKAVLVRGAGPDATILTIDHPTAHTIRTNLTNIVQDHKERFLEIRDVKFEVKAGVTKTAGAAIFQEVTGLFFQNGFTVRNCWFLGVFDGIHITKAGSVTIQDCLLVSPLHAAIVLENLINGPGTDVGTSFIGDNWIWERPHVPPIETYGILATTGSSGLRIHHNSFLGYTRPVYIELQAGLVHSRLHVDHNSFDGISNSANQDPKLWITGQGFLGSLDISSNDFSIESNRGVGIQVDVSAPGQVTTGTISGNTFNGSFVLNPPPPPPATGKGILLAPGAGASCRKLVLNGNYLDIVPTGIEIGPNCSLIHVAENYFGVPGPGFGVPTPLVNADPAPRGAFFPDRIGVGRVNDVTSGGVSVRKEIYAYSGQAPGPRVYLQGVAGASAPGIDFAFDNTNTRRAGIVATASGAAGVQLELFTRSEAGGIAQRAILDGAGNMIFTSANYQEMIELDTAPAAPGANKARLFLRDNGAGKTQLCVLFSTGPVQVLATQP